MRRVASIPEMPSMLMSMRTSSGCRAATCSMASSPDLASPTTSNPGVTPTTERAAMRNGIWSSTISTVVAWSATSLSSQPAGGGTG